MKVLLGFFALDIVKHVDDLPHVATALCILVATCGAGQWAEGWSARYRTRRRSRR